jgi:hypothetical protein
LNPHSDFENLGSKILGETTQNSPYDVKNYILLYIFIKIWNEF